MSIRQWLSMLEGLDSTQCEPIYDHDCPRCVFCGQTALRNHNVVDVYACDPGRKDRRLMSVVLRYSDEPPEYTSMNYTTAQTIPAYQDAVELVKRKIGES